MCKIVAVTRGLFLFVGELNEKYEVSDFNRVVNFVEHWINGPTLSPFVPTSNPYPILPPKDRDDCLVIPLMASFDELVGHLGTDNAEDQPSEVCK